MRIQSCRSVVHRGGNTSVYFSGNHGGPVLISSKTNKSNKNAIEILIRDTFMLKGLIIVCNDSYQAELWGPIGGRTQPAYLTLTIS